MIRSIVCVTCLIVLAPAAFAENWPGWRGPRGDGSIHDKPVPLRWSDTENTKWKVKLDYTGHSSPIIWDNAIFYVGTDQEDQRRMLVRLDRESGKTVWKKTVVASPLEKKHKLNSWSSSTPVTDGKRVFVSFLDKQDMLVSAWDMDGNELWTKRPGQFSSKHGYCSSPVLFRELVIVNGDHDGDAYIVALNQQTGETVWKTPRENKTRSYCCPLIREIDGRTQLMLSGSKCVAGFDPETGKRLWIVDGPTEQFVASLVYEHDLLFVTAGFPEKHVMAIDPRGTGNITESHVRWWHPRREAAYVPSPVVANGYLFVIADSGIGFCYDAKTGEMKWRQRMGRRFSASLLTDGSRVFATDDDGNTKIFAASDKYAEIATNVLGEATYASPAFSDGQLFIRGEQHLFCIDDSANVKKSAAAVKSVR
jgi:outer membrane protein assembly factor BamB